MTDWKPTLLSALSNLPACAAPSFAREEIPLPVIVVADESGGVLAQADGAPLLEEYLFAVNVYGRSPRETEDLAEGADAALTALGLRCVQRQDLYDEEAYAWRKYLRYRAVLKGDLIYQ